MIIVFCQTCFERFIEVSTGRHLQRIHDMDLTDFYQEFDRFCIKKNTNFIVIILKNIEDESTMNIYDLEAMRNPQSAPQEIG
jgi:hypothetical protein